MGRRALDISLQRFGDLVALYPSGHDNKSHIMWMCYCTNCGTEKRIATGHLTRKVKPVKSCGCLRYKTNKDHHSFKGVGEISYNWWNARIHRQWGTRSNRKDVEITIEYGWELFLKQNRKCNLSGLPISFTDKTASLDRIDSSIGYAEGNVQWVHKDINIMKNKYDQDYFIELCNLIVAFNT